MKNLDSNICDLNGVSLIEASAGTGKTYNIQNLFARKIIEEGMDVAEILVVTFTEAATKELRDRLRKILTEVLTEHELYLKTKKWSGNERIKGLLAPIKEKLADHIILRRIKNAIRNFDNASIFTIHGFCQRTLQENAFESGILFNKELITNPSNIVNDIINDFYRNEFYNANDEILEKMTASKIKLDTFVQFQNEKNNYKDIKFSENKTREIREDFEVAWENGKDELPDLLLGKSKHTSSIAKINTRMGHIEKILQSEKGATSFTNAKQLTLDGLNKDKLDDSDLSKLEDNPIIKALPDFINASLTDTFTPQLQLKFKEYFDKEYPRRKATLNVQTFNDLLNNVERRIQNDDVLVNALRKKYRTAMIDEFQDTDSVQWSIFKTIFVDSKDHSIFLVGDPKQAIYGFRGGDIFTYKGASKIVEQEKQYTIYENFRSSESFLKSCNKFFGNGDGNPFADKSISYVKVSSGKKNEKDILTIPAEDKYFEKIKIMQLPTEECSDNVIFEQVAYKILSLLNDENVKIGEEQRNVKPHDFAVLVTSNRGGESMKTALQKYGIPAITSSAGTIFKSNEAKLMLKLLKGISTPENIKLIKLILVSDLFKLTANDIDRFNTEKGENEFSEWLYFFKKLKVEWEEKTFIEIFNKILGEKKVKQKILSQVNGERKLTNLMQLSELIHTHESKYKLSINAVLSWLEKMISDELSEDETETRLESDDNAVQIMTIWKSKGLEFPIVFIPTIYSQKAVHNKKNKPPKFHNKDNELEMDLYKTDENYQKSNEENLQENLRLLYVAITRAKYQCYMMCSTKGNTSPLDYLFSGENKAILKEVQETLDVPKEFLIDKANIPESPKNYHPDAAPILCENRKFPASKVDYNWRIVSFSSLDRGRQKAIIRDIDEADNIEDSQVSVNNELSIFTFQPGVKTGNAWHEIFENIDFTESKEEIKTVSDNILSKYKLNSGDDDIRIKKEKIVLEMVKNVLSANLPINNFKLQDVQMNDRLVELEFYFKLNKFDSSKKLKTLFNNYLKEKFNYEISKFESKFSGGFMNGFIDLVCRHDGKYYIIDWKSNKLGGTPESFNQDGIKKEMSEHNYQLQYLIYTVALHQYLSKNLLDYNYKDHFGGIYYIFLRGVNANNDNGIFHDKPEFEMIEEISEIMGGK